MGTDPYRYFRIEAQEILENLSSGLLELEKGPTPELARRLLRHAHTLKGAARVVELPAIAEAAHELEDLLHPYRDLDEVPEQGRIDELLAHLDRIRDRLAEILHPPEERPASEEGAAEPGPDPGAPPAGALRVDVRALDQLLEAVTEASAACARRSELEELELARRRLGAMARGRRKIDRSELAEIAASVATGLRRLEAASERIQRELGTARERADEIRLVPAAALLADLERAGRDAAREQGRAAEIRVAGADVRLDARVLGALREALLHLVRNAVAHGIEDEAVRRAQGKPATGAVEVDVKRAGRRVRFCCRDDGRGLDEEAVRAALVRAGALDEAGARQIDRETLFRLLPGSGATTRREAGSLAGRGIGLDVVRQAMLDVGGHLEISSAPGRGATFELSVPASLTSLRTLAVRAGGATALIPLDSVRASLRLEASDIVRTPDGDRLWFDERSLPLLPLDRALGRGGREAQLGRRRTAVIVTADGGACALLVERLLGTGDTVVRPVPAAAAADPVVGGAALDAEGHPQLLLDPRVLVSRARAAAPIPDPEPTRRLPVLVVDDSLTTRMLEKSILESAGYEVDVAVSGEEALRKARERRYGLFLIDVEMPGMSGFDLIERARAEPDLREIPAIIVTSRGQAADRRRGKEIGARAYLVKSEFDQEALLEAVRRQIG